MVKKEHIYYLIMILLVIGLGMFALNQTFSWYYKLGLLTNPCTTCKEYNPQYEDCFKEKSTERIMLDTYGNRINNKIKINISKLNITQ